MRNKNPVRCKKLSKSGRIDQGLVIKTEKEDNKAERNVVKVKAPVCNSSTIDSTYK